MRSNRTSVNINDYPEHLNPFHEEDNHARLRFWSITRKPSRSNSFSFQSIKDFKSTLGRSFSIRSKNRTRTSSSEQLPVTSDDETIYNPPQRQTISPDGRYIHQGSLTPLPRLRFHERVKHLEPEQSQHVPVVPANADSQQLEDNNPFNDDYELDRSSTPSPSRPQTLPRKKKRAPPPPAVRQSSRQPAPVNTANITSEDKKPEVTLEQTKVEIPVTEVTEVATEEVHADNSKEVSEDRIGSNVLPEDNTGKLEERIHVDNEQTTNEPKNETVNNCEEKSGTACKEKSKDIDEEKSEASFEEKSETTLEQKSEADWEEKTEDTCTEKSQDTSETKYEDTSETKYEDTSETKYEDTSENKYEDSTEHVPVNKLQTDTMDNNSNKSLEDIAIELSEDNSFASKDIPEASDLNFNSEITILNSEISITSAEQLEERQQQLAIDDTSDLMAMVQKLHMEVQKLTDDTNNNSIKSSNSSDQEGKFNGHYQGPPYSPNKVKTEMNVTLSSDNDAIINSNSSSPRIRIRNDSAWIREAK
ncbi:uncharacterized protein CBL_13668 [Carabus blaptoides fortunei]